MADLAQFDHDRLGHLLADRLLQVPRFQRRYSWHREHVAEYWTDITGSQAVGNSYFMGTVVLASASDAPDRKIIVDGQQRITTTALLLIAIRDRLRELTKSQPASSVERQYLSDYVLLEEENVARLTLSPDDHLMYSILLDRDVTTDAEVPGGDDSVTSGYRQLKGYIDEFCPKESDYKDLIGLVNYLDKNVQVLLAVASGLAEAYIIFETLNDRGADLTTADLLKNYLFSRAGDSGIKYAEAAWTRLSSTFEKAETFVKFIRYEHMSRKGHVTNRGLYKALQQDIGAGAKSVRDYLDCLEKSLKIYVALKEPDDVTWSAQAIEVKDSLLAFRRFGFEASMPLLLAAFSKWSHSDATRFVDTVAAWSVRAWAVGTIGGGSAETSFCKAAVSVSQGLSTKSNELTKFMEFVPEDAEFKQAFKNLGPQTTTKAKYLLAQLEKKYLLKNGGNADGMLDWSSKSVTIEHIYAKSSKESSFASSEDFESFTAIKDQLQNFALLEKSLNGKLEDKNFVNKVTTYKESKFELTSALSDISDWNMTEVERRAELLSELAVDAWPRN